MKHFFFLLLVLLVNIIATSQVDLTNGLIAYYPFKSNTNDISGNGNNGTASGAILTTDKNQISNNAYNFANISDKISVAYSSTLDISATKQFTGAAWIYPTGNTAIDSRIINFGSINSKSYEIIFVSPTSGGDSGSIQFTNYSTGNIINIVSSTKIGFFNWSLVVLTVDGNSGLTQLFVNNILVASSTIMPVIPTSSTASTSPILTMGNHPSFNWGYKGKIDEVRIYKRILNATEISYLYDHYSAIRKDVSSYTTTVSPNPFTEMFEITIDNENLNTVELIDVFGRVLSVESFIKSKEINLSSFPTGSYFLRITNQSGIELKRIQKI